MKLGTVASNPLEWLVLKLGIVPVPLIETQMAFSLAQTIMSAVKLDVFEVLAEKPMTPEQVAQKCATDAAVTEKLLMALASSDYVHFNNGQYSLTKMSRKWLLKDSPHTLRDKLLFQFLEYDTVGQYVDIIKSGKGIDIHQGGMTDDAWDLYQRGMRDMANIAAAEVAKRLPVPSGATAMLDIGGSHGYYSVALCREHPELKSTILDLPEAVKQAAPILAQENMGDRVVHREGNALTDDLGTESWDLIFISNLVHHFSAEQNRELTRRVTAALNPGGVMCILETIRPGTPAEAGQLGALLDLYFAATSESGTWTIDEMTAWQKEAGLAPMKPIRARTMPGAALVLARK